MTIQPPDLTGALCSVHPDPDLWTSEDEAGRARAARVCRYCPALVPCRDWAASLPHGFKGVLGGMTYAQMANARASYRRVAGE